MKNFLLTLIILLVGVQTGSSQDLITVFETDFESYSVGTTPTEMSIGYNGCGNKYQVVTTEEAHSGLKSLQIWGRRNWGANVNYYFDLPASGVIGYEVWVKANPRDSSWVQFLNPEGSTWGWGWAGVAFNKDGYITAPGGFKRPHEEDRWYKVRTIMDVETGACWIWLDDELITDGVTPAQDGKGNPDAFKGIRAFCFGDNSWEESPITPAYFDDFKFYVGSGFGQGNINIIHKADHSYNTIEIHIWIENIGDVTIDQVKLVDTLPDGIKVNPTLEDFEKPRVNDLMEKTARIFDINVQLSGFFTLI